MANRSEQINFGKTYAIKAGYFRDNKQGTTLCFFVKYKTARSGEVCYGHNTK